MWAYIIYIYQTNKYMISTHKIYILCGIQTIYNTFNEKKPMNLKKQGGYVGDSERIKQEERKDM